MADKEIIEETRTGVTVTVKSKRGTGTRDQDTVTVQGQYDDINDARDHIDDLNDLLKQTMLVTRTNDPNGDRE